MEHIKVDEVFVEVIYKKGECSQKDVGVYNYNYSEGSYYHFYRFTDMNKKYEWGEHIHDSYYYPSGGVALYKKGKFYLVDRKKEILNQRGLNPYQWCTIDALCRDREDIELIFLTGVAGSGKTYLSLAYALKMLEKEDDYINVILSRPKQDLERREGFLPGGEMEKIKPYMMPFYDSARSMGYIQSFKKGVKLEEDVGGIIFQPLEKIKGRSFENSIIICDEAEDMRYREIVSLLTRINKCKVILSGDIQQTDDDTFGDGETPLEYACNKFKNQRYAVEIYNPIIVRESRVAKFVINNFSENEYLNRC